MMNRNHGGLFLCGEMAGLFKRHEPVKRPERERLRYFGIVSAALSCYNTAN